MYPALVSPFSPHLADGPLLPMEGRMDLGGGLLAPRHEESPLFTNRLKIKAPLCERTHDPKWIVEWALSGQGTEKLMDRKVFCVFA